MDVASIAAAFITAQAGQMQASIATSVLQSNIRSEKEVASLVAQTTQDARMANLPPGVGNSIDLSA